MSTNTEHRKLAAIMFTDMIGYSALAQRNEALALELLEEHRRVVRGLLSRHGGREVKTTGDGFLLEFSSALAAVQCGVEIQTVLHERNQGAPAGRQFRLRIGIHVGDVVMRDGDIHGDGVNIAARIEPLAEPGGICLSRPVVDQIANKIDSPLVKLGTPELKNIQVPLEVYRVVLPWQGPGPSRAAWKKTGHPKRIRALALGSAALLVSAWGCWFLVQQFPWSGRKSARVESLAVLPFDNLSRDADQAFFTEGMWQLLGSELGKLSALKKVVSSKASVRDYRSGGAKKIPEIAAELQVDAVVEGAVFRDRNQVRITAKLIHGRTDRQLWSDSYTRDLSDVMKLQGEVALAIAREIRLVLTPEEQARLTSGSRIDPVAFDHYVRGRQNLEKWTREGTLAAIDYFRRATQIEPQYAAAHAAIADAYLFGDPGVHPQQANEGARKAINLALASGSSLGEVQATLAQVRFQADWDWAAADATFRRAFELNPHFAHGHHVYSHFLLTLGRTNEALAESLRFLELDPRSPAAHHHMGSYHFLTRQYDLAIQHDLDVLKIDPNYADSFFNLGAAYMLKRRYAEAETNATHAVALSPKTFSYRARLGQIYAAAGKTAEARKVIADLEQSAKGEYFPAYHVGLIYVALKEHDEAFKWLRQGLADRPWQATELPVEPSLDSVRSDPRFAELLAKMGLPIR